MTLPSLLKQGAKEFAWVNPGEKLVAGPESWVPSETGTYVYLMSNSSPIYFPVKEPEKSAKLSEKLTSMIQQERERSKGYLNGGTSAFTL